ncbi:unnamed protein product [Candidula unifasciata]|uniref:DNA 5'-3' helicase n=1 Tax=Candidula unifasciata TaxID=100452 RepID=A0A8S4A5J1_9EUPU|nr:unnamed protein product [Candidula unifasciata]
MIIFLFYEVLSQRHFVCEHCNKQGTWPDLLDNLMLLKTQKKRLGFTCFKDLETVTPFLQDLPSARELVSSCVPFGSLQDDVAHRLKETFGLEVLKTGTLDRFGVRCNHHHNYVIFPVIVNGCVQSVKKITCHSQTDEVIGTLRESYIPRTGTTGVFGLDTVAPTTTDVVLTSSEVDAMAVVQETKMAAIALPRGYNSLPQEVLPSLERFKTIILWFGDDIRAWESAKLFSKKLNSKRCHIIRPSIDDPGPLTALTQGLKLSTILGKARPISHDSIVSFTQLRQEILSQFLHSEQVAGVKWKRYPILNKLLKGHRRGELTVFTGPTGSGKTTFMSEYSLDLCMQGVNTLWGSFEINNVRLGKMMLTQFAQRNLSKNLELFDDYADLFQSLPMYFMTFHGQESVKKVVDAMSHAVYVHDIAHVVLDNLQFMMGVGGTEWNDRFMKQDSMVAAFRKFATNMNCHVTLVIHPRKEKETEDLTTASVFGTAKATQEADNVLILQDKRLTSVRGRKYLQVTKNRFDGELGLMLLKFDKESLGFASKDKERTSRKTDNEDAQNPEDDDDESQRRETSADMAEEL